MISSPRRGAQLPSRNRGPSCTARRLPGLVILFAVVLAGSSAPFLLRAEENPAKPEPPKSDSNRPMIRSLDDLKKLPPNAVLIICEDLKDGVRLVPRGILLTPEEHQKLLEQIEQLRANAKPQKPIPPAKCELTGQVKDNLVHLKADFRFATQSADTLVALGCAQATPTEASLDGHLPLLQSTDDGLVVQVDKPGEHQLALEMDVALVPKGNERGLDLDLPRAPITTLTLDFPDKAIKEARVNLPERDGRLTARLLPLHVQDDKNHLGPEHLGSLARLDLAWKGPLAQPGPTPVLTADGRITVRVGETTISTDIDFTLSTLNGPTAQWRFLLPPKAELIRPRLPDERVVSVDKPDPKSPSLHVLRLKGSGNGPLQVTFQVQQPRTEATLTVGPFAVLGAFPHQGSLVVTAPPDLRLTARPRGEPQVTLSQREITDEEARRGVVTAFNYWALVPAEVKGGVVPALPPFLQLDLETVKGGSATRTAHLLRWTERGWRVTTEIDVQPLQTNGVDHLEIQLPPGYEDVHLGPAARDAGQRLEIDAAARTARVVLGSKKAEQFHIALEGLYPLQAADATDAVVELPQPLKTVDRGGQVTVVLPRDMELVRPPGVDPAWETLSPGKSEHGWRGERTPERLKVAWRVHRPEVVADEVIDVTLAGGQAQIRQRFSLPALAPPAQVLFWVPDAVGTSRLRVGRDRGVLLPVENADAPKKPGYRACAVRLLAPVDREHPLFVDYSYPLPEPDSGQPWRHFTVPLLLPEPATRGEVRLRVWSEPGTLPALVGGGSWEEVARDMGDRPTLPALCLRGTRLDPGPRLRLNEQSSSPLATVLVERALVQATVAESGLQNYRALFLINQLTARHLDVELPAPLAPNLGLKVRLETEDGQEHEVTWAAVDENGQPAEGSRLARLPLGPDLVRRPVVLDLTYQLPPGRALESGLLQTTLCPPVLHGEGGQVPVRFQVRLPPSWVPLYRDGDFGFEQQWGWRGWLLAPRPAVTSADLLRWFFSGFDIQTGQGDTTATVTDSLGWDSEPASLVCWRTNLEPLRLNHVPQQGWLLICSGTLLVVGLGLYLLSLSFARFPVPGGDGRAPGTVPALGSFSRLLFWPVVVTLALVVGCLTLLWPGVLAPILYGCEPGALVLLAVLGLQWMLHQRYRRQVVFLPNFTRAKSGSSLVRGSPNPSGPRPRLEPSTVDLPASPEGGRQ